MGGMFLLGSFLITPYEARLLHLICDPFSKSVPRGQHSRFTASFSPSLPNVNDRSDRAGTCRFLLSYFENSDFADDPFTFVMKPISQNISRPTPYLRPRTTVHCPSRQSRQGLQRADYAVAGNRPEREWLVQPGSTRTAIPWWIWKISSAISDISALPARPCRRGVVQFDQPLHSLRRVSRLFPRRYHARGATGCPIDQWQIVTLQLTLPQGIAQRAQRTPQLITPASALQHQRVNSQHFGFSPILLKSPANFPAIRSKSTTF